MTRKRNPSLSTPHGRVPGTLHRDSVCTSESSTTSEDATTPMPPESPETPPDKKDSDEWRQTISEILNDPKTWQFPDEYAECRKAVERLLDPDDDKYHVALAQMAQRIHIRAIDHFSDSEGGEGVPSANEWLQQLAEWIGETGQLQLQDYAICALSSLMGMIPDAPRLQAPVPMDQQPGPSRPQNPGNPGHPRAPPARPGSSGPSPARREASRAHGPRPGSFDSSPAQPGSSRPPPAQPGSSRAPPARPVASDPSASRTGPSRAADNQPGPSNPSSARREPSRVLVAWPGPFDCSTSRPGPSGAADNQPGPSDRSPAQPGPSDPAHPVASDPPSPRPGVSDPPTPRPGPSDPSPAALGPSDPSQPRSPVLWNDVWPEMSVEEQEALANYFRDVPWLHNFIRARFSDPMDDGAARDPGITSGRRRRAEAGPSTSSGTFQDTRGPKTPRKDSEASEAARLPPDMDQMLLVIQGLLKTLIMTTSGYVAQDPQMFRIPGAPGAPDSQGIQNPAQNPPDAQFQRQIEASRDFIVRESQRILERVQNHVASQNRVEDAPVEAPEALEALEEVPEEAPEAPGHSGEAPAASEIVPGTSEASEGDPEAPEAPEPSGEAPEALEAPRPSEAAPEAPGPSEPSDEIPKLPPHSDDFFAGYIHYQPRHPASFYRQRCLKPEDLLKPDFEMLLKKQIYQDPEALLDVPQPPDYATIEEILELNPDPEIVEWMNEQGPDDEMEDVDLDSVEVQELKNVTAMDLYFLSRIYIKPHPTTNPSESEHLLACLKVYQQIKVMERSQNPDSRRPDPWKRLRAVQIAYEECNLHHQDLQNPQNPPDDMEALSGMFGAMDLIEEVGEEEAFRRLDSEVVEDVELMDIEEAALHLNPDENLENLEIHPNPEEDPRD